MNAITNPYKLSKSTTTQSLKSGGGGWVREELLPIEKKGKSALIDVRVFIQSEKYLICSIFTQIFLIHGLEDLHSEAHEIFQLSQEAIHPAFMFVHLP